MKKILLYGIALLGVSGVAVAKEVSDQEAAENAVIMSGRMSSGWANGYVASLLSIDSEGFFLSDRGELVKPGIHVVEVGASHLSYGSIKATVRCNTVAGHIYAANQTNCDDLGVSKAAGRYFKVEEDRRAQEQIVADHIKYQEYKQALFMPQSAEVLKAMRRDLESKQGGFKEDTDGLLDKVKQQLQPFLEAERKQQLAVESEAVRLQTMKEKEQAAAETKRAKEQAAREAEERQKITLFRKSINEGDETNCGPAVEVKNKLVKVSFAVANYGNEHWIRRDQLFPAGFRCRFSNGEYQPPQ